jgi:hypothetical protein
MFDVAQIVRVGNVDGLTLVTDHDLALLSFSRLYISASRQGEQRNDEYEM